MKIATVASVTYLRGGMLKEGANSYMIVSQKQEIY